MSGEPAEEFQPKGHENAEGYDMHQRRRKKMRPGLGKNYRQGVRYGVYSARLDQAECRTGRADRMQKR